MKTFLEKYTRPNLKEDVVDSFLNGIRATLKTFSPYYLNIAKSKMYAILSEADMEQLRINRLRHPHMTNTKQMKATHEAHHKQILLQSYLSSFPGGAMCSDIKIHFKFLG